MEKQRKLRRKRHSVESTCELALGWRVSSNDCLEEGSKGSIAG